MEDQPKAAETAGQDSANPPTGFTEIAPGIYHNLSTGKLLVHGIPPSGEIVLVSGEPFSPPPGERLVEINPEILDAAALAIRQRQPGQAS